MNASEIEELCKNIKETKAVNIANAFYNYFGNIAITLRNNFHLVQVQCKRILQIFSQRYVNEFFVFVTN